MTSDGSQRALQAIMLKVLNSYVEMHLYSAQKRVLTSRSPQPWMIDKSFDGLFNNIPQYHAVTEMQPATSTSSNDGLNKLLQMVTGQAPQQVATPPATGAQATWDGTQWVPNP